MSYTANPDALRKAGASAKSAGEQAGQVKLGQPTTDIATAMPGGRSEGAAKQVAQSWDQSVRKWSQAATEHGNSLTATADEYQRTDQAGAQNISQVGASVGG
ncbi:hypothetical protein GCM10011581_04660 [Saccharopolyspora subtropica]|uniref:Excreted virulence factor EspC (Type VII ESX diderm) n=1 Tax=Saccharopolyspora thermophila TaxID=89367 RepID=A0A917JIH8_9PSEU|nr:hypothetical protein [Saccharopolyspora subtropica]GGI70731.1 hypothetical protein GCM10011581_04660 [Saccharopolyspora subtropica]